MRIVSPELGKFAMTWEERKQKLNFFAKWSEVRFLENTDHIYLHFEDETRY